MWPNRLDLASWTDGIEEAIGPYTNMQEGDEVVNPIDGPNVMGKCGRYFCSDTGLKTAVLCTFRGVNRKKAEGTRGTSRVLSPGFDRSTYFSFSI